MFKLDTSQARTDLYQIGKGLAQVVDPSITVNANEKRLAEEDAKKARKEKEKFAREEDIYTGLSKLGNAQIFARDQPLFAQKQNEISDYVKKNITKLNEGDAEAMMGFQNLMGNFQREAELSKNTREQWEQGGQKILTSGQHKFRPETLAAHTSFNSPDNMGNYNYDASTVNENMNYQDRVMKELSPQAQRIAQETPYSKKFNVKQAKELIATDLQDPSVFEQAAYDFNKAKDKLGAKDPIEYYQNKYSNQLVVNDTKAGPGSAEAAKPKKDNVSAVVTKREDGSASATINFVDKTENAPLTIDDPNKPGQTLQLIPMGIERNKDGKIFLKGSTKPSGEGENRREGKVVLVDYKKVADVMNNVFGISNPIDLLEGTEIEGVKVKRYDLKGEGKNTGSPKAGDERAVQGGTAVYDGKKWVMKK